MASEHVIQLEDVQQVLLVDDRADNLLALEAALAPLGLAILRATSGIEALRQLLDTEVAAIVLDVQMPDMDGFETASLLKARAATRDIPIIFLTAISHDLEHQLRGYELGACDYVCKPVDPSLLCAKVTYFTELSARQRGQVRLSDDALLDIEQRALGPMTRPGNIPRPAPARNFAQADRVLDVSLDADLQSAGYARALIDMALVEHTIELRERVKLLVSELVANATLHARTECQVRIDIGRGCLRAEVLDSDRRFPTALDVTEQATQGRGFLIVRRLASRWGWTRTQDGKMVWFEIDLVESSE